MISAVAAANRSSLKSPLATLSLTLRQSQPLPDPVRHIRFVHTGETPEQVAAYTESEAAAAATNLGDSTRDLLSTFKSNAEANKFVVHDITAKNLTAEINSVLQAAQTNSLMYPQNLGLDIDKLQVKERRCFDRSIDEPDERSCLPYRRLDH